ncbi:hypothetical protein [Microbacterium sp. SORGH_AS_0888]|uniref:hypothetical protein n=1 Tax=Microbacterium sp. SORGH_AS_0888 TaxID=3041791 RepID=UPI0027D803D2|nr:hypothetical protein [Microbacterium sp. SORGH_AS_0888]
MSPTPRGAALGAAVDAAAVGPPPAADAVRVERHGFDSYVVTRAGVVIGFVEVVGRIHVASQGRSLDRAVEIAQVLDLPAAVQRLIDAA